MAFLTARSPGLLAGMLALACRPAPAPSCPAPAPAPQALFVSQLLLQRGLEPSPAAPDFALTLTASGDALYSGSPRVPVKGQYLGRIGPERFAALVTKLTASGMPLPSSALAQPEPPACHAAAVITLAFQTADGQFGRVAFCAGSEAERQLAGPIYQLVERTRWQPGGPALSLGGMPR